MNEFRVPNPTAFINRANVKRLLLEAAHQHRPFNKFTRVAGQTLIDCNEAVRSWAISRVKQQCSKGKTIV